MIIIDLTTIGTAAVTSLITSFVSKTDSGPIKTLDDIWYFAFGRLSLAIDKKRSKHAAHLESFKTELVQEISSIPDENLIEPPLSIVGPALEASTYYIEEDNLRSMFAKLIASSMDSSKSQYTHHSFVEIIKQLSPLDAQNVAIINKEELLPIVKFGIVKDTGQKSRVPVFTDVFLSNPLCNSIELGISSITNLKRLGLVDVSYDLVIGDETKYEIFHKNAYLQSQGKELLRTRPKGETFIKNGLIEFSYLGKDFSKVCL